MPIGNPLVTRIPAMPWRVLIEPNGMNSAKIYDLAVVGAGIMVLAHAYAAARRGYRVVVFERGRRATGASIRNFGMLWPIGQSPEMLAIALRSREIWLEILDQAKLPYRPNGSLHVVYREDEAAVAEEFAALAPRYGYECQWL